MSEKVMMTHEIDVDGDYCGHCHMKEMFSYDVAYCTAFDMQLEIIDGYTIVKAKRCENCFAMSRPSRAGEQNE